MLLDITFSLIRDLSIKVYITRIFLLIYRIAKVRLNLVFHLKQNLVNPVYPVKKPDCYEMQRPENIYFLHYSALRIPNFKHPQGSICCKTNKFK